MKKNKGFSLVELIIVIAIMAILAAAIAPALIRYIDKSRRADDVTAAGVIATAVQTAMANEAAYDCLQDDMDSTGSSGVVLTAGTSGSDKFAYVGSCTTQNLKDALENDVNSSVSQAAPKIKYKKDAGKGKPATWAVFMKNDKPVVALSTDSNSSYILAGGDIDPSYQ